MSQARPFVFYVSMFSDDFGLQFSLCVCVWYCACDFSYLIFGNECDALRFRLSGMIEA